VTARRCPWKGRLLCAPTPGAWTVRGSLAGGQSYRWRWGVPCRVVPSWSGILVGRGPEAGVDRRVTAPGRAGSGAAAAAHSDCRWARAPVTVRFPPHPRSWWVRAQASTRASEFASCGSQRGISETSRHSSTTPASRQPAADHRDPGPVQRSGHAHGGSRWLTHTRAHPRLGWSHNRCFFPIRVTPPPRGVIGRQFRAVSNHGPARPHRVGLPAAGP
jgi:hypothetical protein